jgi:uncharacterized protein YacL
MKKKYYSKFQLKDKVARNEIARAHGMIVLLVIALMVTLTISTFPDVTFDPILTFVAVVLLALVGLVSLSVFVAVTMKRK